jgi:hypothetical protein
MLDYFKNNISENSRILLLCTEELYLARWLKDNIKNSEVIGLEKDLSTLSGSPYDNDYDITASEINYRTIEGFNEFIKNINNGFDIIIDSELCIIGEKLESFGNFIKVLNPKGFYMISRVLTPNYDHARFKQKYGNYIANIKDFRNENNMPRNALIEVRKL